MRTNIKCFKNGYSKELVDTIDIHEFLNRIANPSDQVMLEIEVIRELFRSNELPSDWTFESQLPLYELGDYSDEANEGPNSSIRLMYLEVPNTSKFDVSNPFVYAAWELLHGNGWGLLVKVSGLTLQNYKYVYCKLGDELGAHMDLNNLHRPFEVIQSFDRDLYVNENSKIWDAHSRTQNALVAPCEIRLVTDVRNKFDLDKDFLASIEVVGKDCILCCDGINCNYSRIFIADEMSGLSERDTLYIVGYQIRQKYPSLTDEGFSDCLQEINSNIFDIPLDSIIVRKVSKSMPHVYDLESFFDVYLKVILNQNMEISPFYKGYLKDSVLDRMKGDGIRQELQSIIWGWDEKTQGPLSPENLAVASERSLIIIEAFWSDLSVPEGTPSAE